MWVRYFESQGQTRYVERPAGVDGWLPIAGLMNLKYFIVTHHVPTGSSGGDGAGRHISAIQPAAEKDVLLLALPVGTLSEVLWKLGRKLFHRNFTVPRWLDIPLRSLKYLLMAFFLFIVISMSAEALNDFLIAPFGIIADVKMLNFFRNMGVRWDGGRCDPRFALCLHPELLVPVSMSVWCVDGHRLHVEPGEDSPGCAGLHRLRQVQQGLPVQPAGGPAAADSSVECTSCMECVTVCPAENALQLSLPPRRHNNRAESERSASAARWQYRTLDPRLVAATFSDHLLRTDRDGSRNRTLADPCFARYVYAVGTPCGRVWPLDSSS